MSQHITTPIGEMWMDDGVLIHRVDTLVVRPDDAAAVRRAVTELAGDAVVPAVVDIRSVAWADADARALFARSPEESHELATALVVDSSASKTMADLFRRIDRPARPIEVFASMDDAMEWARAQLDRT